MSNAFINSSFDSFIEEEGIREEVELGAVKKVLAFQLLEAIQAQHITKTEFALGLETSQAAVDRLLDPENDAVTLHTIKRAASMLGKQIKLELV